MAEPGEAEGQDQSPFGGNMMRFMMQMVLISMAMNLFTGRQQKATQGPGDVNETRQQGPRQAASFRNLYGPMEECDLYVHLSEGSQAPSLAAVLNETLASEKGFELLWHENVWYEVNAASFEVNKTVGPFSLEALSGAATPHIHATLLRTVLLDNVDEIPPEQVVTNSLPITVKLRELKTDAGAENLFAADDEPGAPVKRNLSATKVPYFKTKIEVRPVFDQTVQTSQMVQQGPLKRLAVYKDLGVYQPYLYLSDFWLLEKDYLPLNESLTGRRLNLSLSYSTASLFAWTIQAQMAEQWMVQGEWGLTDTQRDSFMLKRLLIDTNPYLLAFSGVFIALHTVFSMLAFKNDIQFWRKNESMQGLSARSMCVSFVCQLITALYLLDSQETSRLILFEIILDTSLASWKLLKAVKVQLTGSFPFVSISGQKGYEEANTSQYDKEALRYMGAVLTPLFIGYSIKSLIYGKHRGWYSFLVGTAAGGVYTFGFAMMTPQLYINYKLKSVEHLPWRALTYKAMNTFVDDIAAFLIDMPLMHRLSCFRDDIVFFVYLYQRWKYRVDKTRPSIWVEETEGQKENTGNAALVGESKDQKEKTSSAAPAAATDSAAPAAADSGSKED